MGSAAHPKRLGRYEVVSMLAQGGMAELFLAQLPGIQGFAKRVVVKRVLPNLARDREFIEMFLEEARLAALLHHQNIVQVQDIGHDDAGYFFTMEYLHGSDIGELLSARDAALPMSIALEITRGACAGLHYAHERRGPDGKALGIVHRDVSPQNLFVTFDGSVKLLDFGIAKAVQQISSHYTRSGTLRGKLPYMSPEQCQGEQIDRRSDVFSLSVVLWEMTVGRRLFGNATSDFEILKAIVERDAPAPSSVVPSYPAALERIVMRGLARDRTQRYQSADELQSDIEGFIRASGEWITAREVAAFLRSELPDRAAASMRVSQSDIQQAEGEIVPFPRATRPLAQSPQTEELPRASTPARELATPPPSAPVAHVGASTREATTVERSKSRGQRTLKIVAVVAGALGIAAVSVAVGYKLRGPAPPPASTPTTKAAPPGQPSSTAPRTPDSEDRHWLVAGDYLVSSTPLNNGRTKPIYVGKLVSEIKQVGDPATLLTADGSEVRTTHYWPTHVATADELVIGRLAFCYTANPYAPDGAPPLTKQLSRTGEWSAGKITDTADIPNRKVSVANLVCDTSNVRVVDP